MPDGHQHEAEGWTTRLYRRLMTPLLQHPGTPVAVSRRRSGLVAAGAVR